ncbi:hypothetical protein [Maribacter litoralis]|uniref:Uncharacterized protein n=1 Tax=Maribacter litoralis TaxID=2059726 RepID=A0A653SLW9_9FLAO|nr:hypothetical protein [Maribacter litoralis]VXB67921.1 hypothetical protein MARI151_30327 [Maribacter litoralis]
MRKEKREKRKEKIELATHSVLHAANNEQRTTNNEIYDNRYNKEETIGISGTV